MQRRLLIKAALNGRGQLRFWAHLPLLQKTQVLKIGFVGVTSGPAAAWGISNQRSMEARAAWINENWWLYDW